MYQTVGQDAINLVAEALDVPLYRRVIRGSAIEQGSEYGTRHGDTTSPGVSGDETEDLYELLRTVIVCPHQICFRGSLNDGSLLQTANPEIKGVSVGAILSNYQRVRVEHVSV
jgi:diphthine-ammonia ligase